MYSKVVIVSLAVLCLITSTFVNGHHVYNEYDGVTSDQYRNVNDRLYANQRYPADDMAVRKQFIVEETKRNGPTLYTISAQKKIPLTVEVPALEKPYRVYFPPNSHYHPFVGDKGDNGEEEHLHFPLKIDKIAPVDTPFDNNFPRIVPPPGGPLVRKEKKIRYVYETPPYLYEDNESTEIASRHQHSSSAALSSAFAYDHKSAPSHVRSKVVHFTVKIPSKVPVKVQYSPPLEVNHSLNDFDGFTGFNGKAYPVEQPETPSGFHAGNNYKTAQPFYHGGSESVSSNFRVIGQRRPPIYTELSSAGRFENSEAIQSYPVGSHVESVHQTEDDTGKLVRYVVRSSSGSSDSGTSSTRIVLSPPPREPHFHNRQVGRQILSDDHAKSFLSVIDNGQFDYAER